MMTDRERIEEAARLHGEAVNPIGGETGLMLTREAFVAGAMWAQETLDAPAFGDAPTPAKGGLLDTGTAFIKLRLTDPSLAGITQDIETAILDGVRRALARVELAADTAHDAARP